jgi:Glu-tRNA(Gln) amidotransferase subunit E-like FAD-binding protein
MYPDTDSPPTRIIRDRVERLQADLPEPPWIREERYSSAGVPRDTIFYLIRRGGARLVDLVVGRCDANVKKACFFFGERIKGLRRCGVDVDRVTDESWCEFFGLLGKNAVLMEAWKPLVEVIELWPYTFPGVLSQELGLGAAPDDWREDAAGAAQTYKPDYPDGSRDQHLRFLMGCMMNKLRGRVPAAEIARALSATAEDRE